MTIHRSAASIIWDDVPSSAVETLILQPKRRRVIIEWRSGSLSDHSNVRKRDMLRLLNPYQSVGEWVNTYTL
jgi:hypothetical protein